MPVRPDAAIEEAGLDYRVPQVGAERPADHLAAFTEVQGEAA